MIDVPTMLKPMIDEHRKTHGHAVQGVMAEPPFYYTIGLACDGLPELLLIGNFNPASVTMILNAVAAALRARGKPFDEGLQDAGLNLQPMFRNCGPLAKSEFTIQAGQYLGREDYAVQQIILCDKAGKFPREPGVHPDFDVPLL